jgi:superfamily II DNA/RNA helicase
VPFRDLGVDEIICSALDDAGIHTTFPIQALTLPLAIDGQDIIGQARTGTGKTLAFGVPILHRLATTLAASRAVKQPAGLIVVPTRELAVQVGEDLKKAGAKLGARVLTIYGGRAYEPQIETLAAGTDIVVGTPGRLLDLANRKNLDLSQIHALVLDEADKMLDLGFLPDVERLLRLTPATRQTMLFSATMPGEVVTLARRHMHRATNIRAEEPEELAAPPLTTQHSFRTHQMDKVEVLARVLQAKDRGLSMVFCQTKRAADQVTTALTDRGFAAAAVHGDLGQSQRERALRAFRAGKIDVLVATDVAARGIDVDDVTHVINYECPDDEKTYLHRIGRTGRAGRAGVAVTFVDWRDMQRWKNIDGALRIGQPEPAETYSTSEHLFTELSIPPGVTGKLPRELRGVRAGLAAEEEEDLGETGRPASRGRSSGGGDRSRNRSRSRKGGDSPARDRDAAPATAEPGDKPAEAAAPRARRSRRRTRGGHDVAREASAESAVTPESAPRAS